MSGGGGFFGFNAVLPERRSQQPQHSTFGAQSTTHDDEAFGAGATEDIAVYTWGTEGYDDGLGNALMEGGDDLNDLTFGDGPTSNDFQFSHHAPDESFNPRTGHGKSNVKSSSKKRNEDLFASTEADFFAAPKKSGARSRQKETSTILSSSKPSQTTSQSWQAAPPPAPAPVSQPRVRTLQDIEAEMLAQSQQVKPATPVPAPQPNGPRPVTMEELERQMMQNMTMGNAPSGSPAPQVPAPAPPPMPVPPINDGQQQHPAQPSFPLPGQSSITAMFPPLGAPPISTQSQQVPALATPSGIAPTQQPEQVTMDLERKIMETEMAEAKRRRKALKIASMAKYNDIMTGGDKEFITRIQLSQLVTQDPYASDFYAQVYSAIARSKMAAQGAAVETAGVPGVLQVGADGRGVGVGVVRGGPGRSAGRLRDNAMQRMTMQVKRIVENAKSRGMKPASATLQGALGTTGKRSTAAAPRPALQVSAASRNSNVPSLTTMLTAGGQPGARNADGQSRIQPITAKQVALRLEALYEAVLDLEQLRRNQPPPPGGPDQQPYVSEEAAAQRASHFEEWVQHYEGQVENMWQLLMVTQPLDICNPHPFISLLGPIKGHRIFGRLMRHLSSSRALTVVILLFACFPQLDVVKNAPSPASLFSGLSLDAVATRDNRERLRATESFLAGVVPVLVGVIGNLDIKLIAGLINMCRDHWDPATIMCTRPGIAIYTIMLSRAEMVKHAPADPNPAAGSVGPSQADMDLWNNAFLGLVRTVLPKLPSIFPSSQAQSAAFGPAAYLLGAAGGGIQAGEIGSQNDRAGMMMDVMDGEVWGLIAAMALHAPPEEQTALVSVLREKILHTVQSAKKGWVSPPRAEVRLRNVNLFLNGLGLDATMLEL